MYRPRVVIVDDSPELLSVMADAVLQHGPYQVVQFAGETTTLDDIVAAQPDLLILDLRLGWQEEGWHLLEAVRADPQLRAVPVILCSADLPQLRERAVEIASIPGVSALEKPFRLNDLERLLQATLGVSGRADQFAAAEPA